MSQIDKIRAEIAKRANGGKGTGQKIFFWPMANKKYLIRVLADVEDWNCFNFYENWDDKVQAFGGENWDNDDCWLRHDKNLKFKEKYAILIWNYAPDGLEDGQKPDKKGGCAQLMLTTASVNSAVPSLLAYYDENGTLLSNDYTLQKAGSKSSQSFTLIPKREDDLTVDQKAAIKEWTRQRMVSMLKGSFKLPKEYEPDLPKKWDGDLDAVPRWGDKTEKSDKKETKAKPEKGKQPKKEVPAWNVDEDAVKSLAELESYDEDSSGDAPFED